MSANYSTRKGWTSKKGAFLNGAWHCDCDPRLPAEKFQTKNGGKNHGRWFYTCQKGKPKSCGFFLWNDDARIREEGAVLSNSRSEPTSIPTNHASVTPQTPKKPLQAAQQPTPETRTRKRADSSQAVKGESDEESFEWPSGGDEALAVIAAQASANSPPPHPMFETPRKAAKTNERTSPSKRLHEETQNESTIMLALQSACDLFTTPATSHKTPHRNSRLASPLPTPAQKHALPPAQAHSAAGSSTLAQEAITILRKNPTPLLPSIEQDLIDLLNLHDLRTQGVIQGREISRLAVATREKRIAELEKRIAGLEMEKETQRQVIGHLKQDMATSPTKSSFRGRGGVGGGGFTTP